MTGFLLAGRLPTVGLLPGDPTPPVTPPPDQAREWLATELAKPEYQAAQPTWWDQLSKSLLDWLGSLFQGGTGPAGEFPWWTILLGIAVIGIAIAAYFVYGAPRRNRRSATAGSLFGDDDDRSAAQLRADASTAAGRGDWALAIAELFRALARRLDERTVVALFPGTTAHGFARSASRAYPDHAPRLEDAASAFDAVRYLGEPGSRDQYEQLRALEAELRDRKTAVLAGAAAAPGTAS